MIGYEDDRLSQRKSGVVDEFHPIKQDVIRHGQKEVEDIDTLFVCYVAADSEAEPLYGMEDKQRQGEAYIEYRGQDNADNFSHSSYLNKCKLR